MGQRPRWASTRNGTAAQSRDGRRASGESSVVPTSIAGVGRGGVTGTQYIQTGAHEGQVNPKRGSGRHRRSSDDGARGGKQVAMSQR